LPYLYKSQSFHSAISRFCSQGFRYEITSSQFAVGIGSHFARIAELVKPRRLLFVAKYTENTLILICFDLFVEV